MYSVCVFSKGKPEMTYTAEWFKQYGFDRHHKYHPIYVVSPGDDVKQYRKTTGCEVVVSDSHNLPSKRQWAVDNFTTRFSPWLLFFEDNIQRVTAVKRSHYDLPQIRPTSREIYHTVEYSPQRVIMKMREDIQLAEEIGACFGGYACNDNHYFRKKKHRHVAFVWTKMAYCKRGGPKWPEYAEEKDDYAYTAECLSRGMPVVVNNYLYPWSVRYEGRGGSRTIKERAKDRRQVVRELERRFPGMFRLKHKPNSPEGTEIQLSVCTEKQLEKWRKEHATAR